MIMIIRSFLYVFKSCFSINVFINVEQKIKQHYRAKKNNIRSDKSTLTKVINKYL